jgi:PAS domain-containing protein
MTDPFRFEKLTAQNRNLVTKLQKLLLRERELIDNQRQIDALFDNAPVELYLKDREGRYLRINKQFEKIFGVKNSDLIGKLPTDVHNPELASDSYS